MDKWENKLNKNKWMKAIFLKITRYLKFIKNKIHE